MKKKDEQPIAFNKQLEEEKEFLKNYDASKYERPSVTGDVVIFTIDEDDRLNVLLIKRGDHPFKGHWAIPGGFLNVGKESIDECAARELEEETGITGVYLKQLKTFGDVGRDPRTTVISVAYTALVPKDMLNIQAGDDASDAKLFRIGFDVRGLMFSCGTEVFSDERLAFDHKLIINEAITRLRNRIDYEDDAFSLLKDRNEFTIPDLKKIYETIKNRKLDLPNFRKKFLKDYVETGKVTELQKTVITRGRVTKLYKLN